MKILYVVNGLGFSANMPIGGADKRVSEIGQRFKQRGDTVAVLTTDEGERLLREDGLNATFFKTEPPSFWQEGWFRSIFGRVLSYLYLAVSSVNSLPKEESFDIVYPSSDYFFDLLPALNVKKRRGARRLVGIVHHRLDWPWRRHGNAVANFLLFFSQRIDFLLFKFFDLVFVPANREGDLIKRILVGFIGEKRISFFENGVDFAKLGKLPEVEKRFDACFLGGFRPSKGVLDIVPVWQEVVKKLPEARILVIGGGTKSNEQKVELLVTKSALSKNIIFAGVLGKENLFSFVKACRIFVSPSYEEGWGIALMEAMACGLPAVVYDLSAFGLIDAGIIRVPLGDTTLMAESILELLGDEKSFQKIQRAAVSFAPKFDWSRAFDREYGELWKII